MNQLKKNLLFCIGLLAISSVALSGCGGSSSDRKKPTQSSQVNEPPPLAKNETAKWGEFQWGSNCWGSGCN